MMTMTENKAYGQKAYACNVCGKEGLGANIKTHIESNHIESNITHSCDVCGKISRSRNGLRLHKAKEHSREILLQDRVAEVVRGARGAPAEKFGLRRKF